MRGSKIVAIVVLLALVPVPIPGRAAGPAPAAPPGTTPDGFPRTHASVVGTLTVYQPQVESWDNDRLVYRAACSVLPPGAEAPIFGVVRAQGNTQIDKPSRSVLFYDSWIESVSFPSAPDKAAAFKAAFAQMLPAEGEAFPLDRLEAELLISKAEVAQQTQPVKNAPPQIIVSWTLAWTKPEAVDSVAQKLAKEGVVDLMDVAQDKAGPSKTPTLATANPTVIVATRPVEVIVTEGPIEWTPLDGTSLLHVSNTTGNAFMSTVDQPVYVLISGRWFRAGSIAAQTGVWFISASLSGPWSVAMSVPPAIDVIPTSSPIHHVTYVQICDAQPNIGGTVWIAPPPTYGYAVGMTYTPWTGWTYGDGVGWGWGAVAVGVGVGRAMATAPCWGPMPHDYHPYYAGAAVGACGGAAAWGASGGAATTGNVYSHYGSTSAVTRSTAGYNAWTGNAWSSEVGHSYNSVTGQRSAGQTASVSNAYTGQSASYARGAVSGPGGRGGGGGGGWGGFRGGRGRR